MPKVGKGFYRSSLIIQIFSFSSPSTDTSPTTYAPSFSSIFSDTGLEMRE